MSAIGVPVPAAPPLFSPPVDASVALKQHLISTGPRPDLSEAARLLAGGWRLCRLEPYSKAPSGMQWNKTPVQSIEHDATGYGIILAQNGVCSVDVDRTAEAARFLSLFGFDIEAILNAGVRVSSTRPGSGGKAWFRVPAGLTLHWEKMSFVGIGTIIEFRASSENLQDALPGCVYFDQRGEAIHTQRYANCKRLGDLSGVPELPETFARFWQALSTDLGYKRQVQEYAGQVMGLTPHMAISDATGRHLAFASPNRVSFNQAHGPEWVYSVLREHNYQQVGQGERVRFKAPDSIGQPGIRKIPGKDDLWRSDHGSDALHGTFDAWTVNVVLCHDGSQAEAETAWAAERAVIESRRLEGLFGPVPVFGSNSQSAALTMWPPADVITSPSSSILPPTAAQQPASSPFIAPPPVPAVRTKFQTFETFDEPIEEDIKMIIEGLLPEGITTLAGQRGRGKTTAVIKLMLHAAGLIAIPHLAPVGEDWRHVILSSEDVMQVRHLLRGECVFTPGLTIDRIAERIHVTEALRESVDATVAALALTERFARVSRGVSLKPLIIFDTFAANVDLADISDNAEVSRMMAAVKQARANILITTHTAKSATGENQTAIGAQALESDANGCLVFVEENGKMVLKHTKKRFSTEIVCLSVGTADVKIAVRDAHGVIGTRFVTVADMTAMWRDDVTKARRKDEDLALDSARSAVWMFIEDTTRGNPTAELLGVKISKNTTKIYSTTKLLNERYDGQLSRKFTGEQLSHVLDQMVLDGYLEYTAGAYRTTNKEPDFKQTGLKTDKKGRKESENLPSSPQNVAFLFGKVGS